MFEAESFSRVFNDFGVWAGAPTTCHTAKISGNQYVFHDFEGGAGGPSPPTSPIYNDFCAQAAAGSNHIHLVRLRSLYILAEVWLKGHTIQGARDGTTTL